MKLMTISTGYVILSVMYKVSNHINATIIATSFYTFNFPSKTLSILRCKNILKQKSHKAATSSRISYIAPSSCSLLYSIATSTGRGMAQEFLQEYVLERLMAAQTMPPNTAFYTQAMTSFHFLNYWQRCMIYGYILPNYESSNISCNNRYPYDHW